MSPIFFTIIVLITLIILIFFSKIFFSSRTDESIYLGTTLIGNTGNLGIPLGIALFGVESVPYTSIINIANIFLVYTICAYFFAREQYSLKNAIISIAKIPAIWFAIFALLLNHYEVPINEHIKTALDMGASTALTIQLFIFGVYLCSVRTKTIPWKLSLHISFAKHILLPLVGILVIVYFTDFNSLVASILIMELMMPLAVSNINFAVLYNCKANDVAATTLISSIVFVGLLYFYIEIINYFIK